ncbi:MAG TPA: protein kinase [Polyangiaceae bacterium]
MLSAQRILLRGRSAHSHEQEALAFIRESLPDQGNLLLWELVELVDPTSGRLHEIDALILGYQALYVVEIKSGPGLYTGDTVDWQRQEAGGPVRYMDPPYKLTNFKAKVLKGMLERKMQGQVPWVQALVFLSHQDVKLAFRNYGDQCVVTRKRFARAITYHEFPGSDGQRAHARVNQPQAKAVAAALEVIGVRPSQGTLRVGAYEVGEVLESGPGYEDRIAEHSEQEKMKRRARVYLVPEQTSVERRQQLRRAANREAQLLEDVKGHPNILRISDYVSDTPLGPTVLFDHFDGMRLDAFLRQEEVVSFSDGIEIIAQVGRALDHCHKKEVYHGSLSPHAVLVKRDGERKVDCRLYNFQLGGGAQVSNTIHWSALGEESWAVYQAPELRENPAAPRSVADMFSLGALAYFVLTGKAPAESSLAADQRLREEHCFDPRTVDDGILEDVAGCIRNATEWYAGNRFDDASAWVELLLSYATAPTAPTPELSPLDAKAGDELGDLRVVKVLGQGASSRVLLVERASDGRQCALKVALNEHEDARLEEEALVLGDLRHSRIVQLYDAPVIGGRKCLLLALAGTETLQRRLKHEGLVSLDYAARFGEDLLSALEEVEERSILHRDVKPANLGVGPVSKKAHHLVLFDFSLGLDLRSSRPARHGVSQLGVGTTAYRDPYLVDRGAWDHAADRWSAAVTLHEMLTGTRPTWEPAGASARDPEAKLVLAAERFDASIRDRLTAFFAHALRPGAGERHESAAAMRLQWNQCFAAAPQEAPSKAPPEEPAPSEPSTPEPEEAPFDYATVASSAPLAALPLSHRALNALDRAGITCAGELGTLPDNRLSAVRGVGKHVVKEVIEVKRAWLLAHSQSQGDEAPFFAGYGGADKLLSECTFDAQLRRVLADAGLGTLAALAAVPKTQVLRLAERAECSAEELLRTLEREQAEEQRRAHPSSTDGWLRALLPKQKKRAENLKVLFGLGGPLAGRTDVTVAEAARALEVTAPALYIALAKAKEDWLAHPELDELRSAAREVVGRAGGAATVERGAEALLEKYPPTPALDELFDGRAGGVAEERRPIVAAAALLRIVGLVEKDREDGLAWERLETGKPWLLGSPELAGPVLALGEAADELARRETVAASGETIRVLQAAVEGTPFAQLPDERLTELAADASRTAARSSRLEIYPRGLSAARALQLSTPALTSRLSPEAVRSRVRARYPEAEPLPPRPELDLLLSTYGLTWNETTQLFERPGDPEKSQITQFDPAFSTLPTHQRHLDPERVEASDFEERIRIALERRRVRVLGVSTQYAAEAALALRDKFRLELVLVDERLWRTATELIAAHGVDEDLVHAADRAGPTGSDWHQLRSLMQEASERVLEELLARPEPCLLAQLGLLARYRLDDFLRKLVHQCREGDGRPLFLLVPRPDIRGVPLINGTLAIPEVGPPDALVVPTRWVGTVRGAH